MQLWDCNYIRVELCMLVIEMIAVVFFFVIF